MRAVPPIIPTEADVTVSSSISPLPASMVGDAFAQGLTFSTGPECALPNGWPMCQGDVEAEKTGDTFPDDVGFRSFMGYYAIENCADGYMSATSETDKALLARLAFDAIKHQVVARQLWLGAFQPSTVNANGVWMNPNLRDAAVVPAGFDSAIEPISRIARLVAERQQLAGSGRVLIHGPLVLVPYLIEHAVIRQVGGRYIGPGFTYVTDGGYPDDTNDADDDAGPIQTGHIATTDADGAVSVAANATYYQDAAGTVWLYATGDIEYAWGNYVTKTSLGAQRDNDGRYSEYTTWANRLNETLILVEQPAFLRFDPCNVIAGKAYVPAATQGEAP